MRRRAGFATFLLLAVLAGAGGARADGGGSGACETKVTGPGSYHCHFTVRGFPTTVHVAVGGSGPVGLEASITLDATESLTVAELARCASSGDGFAECRGDVGDVRDTLDSTKQLFVVSCRATVTGDITDGVLECISGLGF